MTSDALLGPAQIRDLAGRLGLRPAKARGQNFVVDAGTIRRIVRVAGVRSGEQVVEVGPGLGSLTLGLLEAGALVTAVEIDPVLARELPVTVADVAPGWADRLTVVAADALAVTELPGPPTALVANLPYNVAVPVLLTFLARFEGLEPGKECQQDGHRDVVRQVGDQGGRRPGQLGDGQRVGRDDRQPVRPAGRDVGDRDGQLAGQDRVDLHGCHERADLEQAEGEGAETGADLDHLLPRTDSCHAHDPPDRSGVDHEVLAAGLGRAQTETPCQAPDLCRAQQGVTGHVSRVGRGGAWWTDPGRPTWSEQPETGRAGRPLAPAGAGLQSLRALQLLGGRGVRRQATATHGCPRAQRELVQAVVQAVARDGAGVAAGLALGQRAPDVARDDRAAAGRRGPGPGALAHHCGDRRRGDGVAA